MPEIVEVRRDLIRTQLMPIHEFLALPAFPGHRDSESRAKSARHLHAYVPEHVDVALGEYLDGAGEVRLVRITGNTRAFVWAQGLSDKVPSHVRASVFSYTSEAEVREAGLRFDSPEASWKARDYAFRAAGLTFADTWRPRSAEGKSSRLFTAIRHVSAYESGHYEPERGSHAAEQIMPLWAEEIKALDRLCETPLAVPNGNFTTGIQAAVLLLLRYEEGDLVESFVRMSRADEGTKNEQGMDGVMLLVELMKSRGRGRGSGRTTKASLLDDVRRTLTAFVTFMSGTRLLRPGTRIDPVGYCREQRDHRRK